MSNITIITEVPPVAPSTETVNGKRLPTEALRVYMERKGDRQKLGRDFWQQLRRELNLDPAKKYKVRLVGVVLEK